MEILNQIEVGIRENLRFDPRQSARIYKVLDRREAIKKAISLAKKGDTVVMTGKGSEDWMHIANGKKVPWNEKEVVEDILKIK